MKSFDVVKKALKNQRVTKEPSGPEKRILEIISKNNFPIRYTGNGTFWIFDKKGCRNPDFKVNGRKQVLEICYGINNDGKFLGKTTDWVNKTNKFYKEHNLECLIIDTKKRTEEDITLEIRKYLSNGIKVKSVKKISNQVWSRTFKKNPVVYNLEVEEPNTYLVENGLVVHNCLWSYWWMTEFFLKKNPELGKKVFQVHESEYYGKC